MKDVSASFVGSPLGGWTRRGERGDVRWEGVGLELKLGEFAANGEVNSVMAGETNVSIALDCFAGVDGVNADGAPNVRGLRNASPVEREVGLKAASNADIPGVTEDDD